MMRSFAILVLLLIVAAAAWAMPAVPLASHIEFTGTAPTPSSCGNGATVVGNDNVGRVTVGSIAGTTCTLTFTTGDFSNPPVCFAQDEITSLVLRATSTTTKVVTFTSTLTLIVGDTIAYYCVGFY